MYCFKTVMQQADGNAYMYLKALLVWHGDSMTLEVLNDAEYGVTLMLSAIPQPEDIEIHGLIPAGPGSRA